MLVFKDFVEQNDLEFYSIGADPAKLMAYMVSRVLRSMQYSYIHISNRSKTQASSPPKPAEKQATSDNAAPKSKKCSKAPGQHAPWPATA